MDAGLSVRKAAARMGAHWTTAFRWRHRFLAARPRHRPADRRDARCGAVQRTEPATINANSALNFLYFPRVHLA